MFVRDIDPVILYGKIIAHRLKGTLWITGWYCLRDHICGSARHLDVGSTHPSVVDDTNG